MSESKSVEERLTDLERAVAAILAALQDAQPPPPEDVRTLTLEEQHQRSLRRRRGDR